MTLVANILKKVKQAGYVRYLNGNLLDKDDGIISSVSGGSGTKEVKIQLCLCFIFNGSYQ